MSELIWRRLDEVVELVIDNRGKNPKSYSENGIPVIDNYLITSNGEVDLKQVNRYIDEETYNSFLRKYVVDGDVLMTLVGNGYGKVAITPSDKCAIIQNTIGLRCNKYNNNKFLYYLLRNNRESLMNLNRGAAQPSIKVGDVLDLKFTFPDLNEQKSIANILGAIDDKIQLNRQINQNLESMAQAIFQSWFVDFDPVKAKIAAREQWQILTDDERTEWLNELLYTQDYFKTCLLKLTAKAGLSDVENEQLESSLNLISCRGHGPEGSENLDIGLNNLRKEWQSKIAGPALQSASETLYLNIAAMTAISSRDETSLADMPAEEFSQLYKTASLFPERLVDSELGEIPEGWEASTLGQHFNVVMGQSPKGDTYNEDGEGMVFFQGRRDFGFRYPTPRVYTTDPKRIAQAGDTLISVRAPVGDRNMADQECCLGRGVASIKHKAGARSFTFSFIGHIEKNLSESGSSGTVFSSINKNELSAVKFVAPSLKLLKVFENNVENLDQQVEINSNEIQTLEVMRDSLLPKLLSGELEMTFKFDN
jgi:restriction endonuclease S subunit